MPFLMPFLMALLGGAGAFLTAGRGSAPEGGGNLGSAHGGGKGNHGNHGGHGSGGGNTPPPPPPDDEEEEDDTSGETGGGGSSGGSSGGTGGGSGSGSSGSEDPGTPGGGSAGAPHLETPIGEGAAEVMTGRVATLRFEGTEDASSMRILEGPSHGNVTVNPDNSFALVLTGETYTGSLSFKFEVTHADGAVTTHSTELNAVPGTEALGWGTGEHYMLETDENGDVVVEAGDNHREVYISNSSDALSRADIARLEGLNAEQITGSWLKAHPEYGGSEDMALKPDAGMDLWYTMVGRGTEPSSDWLLFERGYDYDDVGRVIDRGAMGESELHPLYIGAYGEGSAPVISSTMRLFQDPSSNIVVQGLHVTGGIQALGPSSNLLLDDMTVTHFGLDIQKIDGFTLRNSNVYDVVRESGTDPDYWQPHPDRIQGIYLASSKGVLVEGNFFDHNGWADDYEYDRSTDGGQAPSMYSQNVYIQYDNVDVTLRDNILMRGSSFGAQVRSGGYIEDNLFLDNNAALNALGGNYDDHGFIGHYSLILGNVVTSGAHKTVNHSQGALTAGIDAGGLLTTMVDNIVAHLADPNNPAELADKVFTHWASSAPDTYYDDTIVYNWAGSRDHVANLLKYTQNTDGLNPATLDQTTIQIFTAELLGKSTATIADLADYLRAQAAGAFDTVVDADLIIRFFQEGFGITPDIRGEEATLRFVPSDLGEGVRWDNRLNWTTQDLPGTQDHDSVDLHGNWVNYGTATTHIDDLDFGEGGKLSVTAGYLSVDREIGVGDQGATLLIDRAGQFWTDGYGDEDRLTVDVEGGRFVNTGIFKGQVDMTVGDNGQAILATGGASFDLSAGSELEIVGDDAKVGFDGTGGIAMLRLDDDSVLKFTAEDGGIGTIGEFRSGKFGDAPQVASGANLGNATLSLDLTGMDSAASQHVLMSVNELIGNFEDLEVTGIGSSRDVEVVVDYASDTVTLKLGAAGAGTGAVKLSTAHLEDAIGDPADALWQALTAGHGVLADDPIHSDVDDEDMADILH